MKVVAWMGWVLFVLLASAVGLLVWFFYEADPYTDPECTVAGVPLQGDLYTYGSVDEMGSTVISSEDVMYYLESAEMAENISVILLEIDSYGGTPVAAEEIAEYIKKSVTKPVIAQIRQAGMSGAYWAASASDMIFASALSDVGSIGVTMSYVDNSISNEEGGYTFNEINSGKFKDSGNPEKPLTEAEREIFQRDVDITFDAFVRAVAENRQLDIAEVRGMADGSSMLGEMAKDRGLIDRIGGIHEVKEYIKDTYTVEPTVCWP